MIDALRIQNFRSIHDASMKLGQVNLFIGPNNSGKTNALKAVTMLGAYLAAFPRAYPLAPEQFQVVLPRNTPSDFEMEKVMNVSVRFSGEPNKVAGLAVGYAYRFDEGDGEGSLVSQLSSLQTLESSHTLNGYFDDEDYRDMEELPEEIWNAQEYFRNIQLYNVMPSSFVFRTGLSNQPSLEATGRNITAFLYTLSQNHEDNFAKLRVDFARCVGSLTSVSVPPDPANEGSMRLKFFDSAKRPFWAEEVSEGVLYFLALLCIVHQPDPPKLLLLEEPEKGIHPRRIKEVMAFIFELARLRDIQIILTSHSPYVVDHFKDFPECVSVFDRDPETGETIIHNAKDLIDKTNAEYELEGLPPTDYSSSLGEYWVSGFLGGVPL